MFELAEIGERLRTQDNRITADPIFVVQEKIRIYGIDTDFDPPIAWLYEDESVEADDFEAAVLELSYHYTDKEPEGYRRLGYCQRWENRQPFFTEAAALRYIEGNGHRHSGELRVYADSAYRNPEWQAVRKHLMEQGSHKWTGCRQGGSPAEEGSYEHVRYCEVCGMEDTCEDPLPPCPGPEPPCPNCQGTRTVTWRHDDGDELTGACPECTEER